MVLRLEFEPYQDFYPAYYADAVSWMGIQKYNGKNWEAIESKYDIIKNRA
jgi:hypothetical protein